MPSKELVYTEMWEVSCGVKAGLVVSLSYIYSAGRDQVGWPQYDTEMMRSKRTNVLHDVTDLCVMALI